MEKLPQPIFLSSLFQMKCKGEIRFQALIKSLPNVAVQGYDRHRKVIYWNRASENLYGYKKEEAIGQKIESLIIPEKMRQRVIAGIENWIYNGIEIPASELELQRKDGTMVAVMSSHAMLYLGTDEPELFCVDVDLTTQREVLEKLKIMATQDALTGLPNRQVMEKELERKIKDARVYTQQFALLFIDLDHFKEVNDIWGHYAGDRLLKLASERINKNVRHHKQLSRFGGDEFVLLLPTAEDYQTISLIVERLISAFREPFCLKGDCDGANCFKEDSVYVTISVGISLFPNDGDTVVDLFKNADTAMFEAKRVGRNCYRFYSSPMNEALQKHQTLMSGLHQAIDRDEFHLVYQPQVNLKTGAIVSCEALLRWKPENPDINTSPAYFIPVAERSDLILHIGDWVMHQACQQRVEWKKQGFDSLRVDVNVSGKQLTQPGYFENFFKIIKHYALSTEDIGIELTENVLVFASETLIRHLEQAKEKGLNVSLDDFGTGYSSLSYLKNLPVGTLKIDQVFVKGVPDDIRDMAIIRGIVQVGHTLGLTIVIEGIETLAQSMFFQASECDLAVGDDLAQGYYYHKPLLPEAFQKIPK